MFPCFGVGPGVERGGARLPGEVRWARDERVWVCELGLWRAGGGPAASGCACVCVSGGGSRPASPQGARVPGRVRVGREGAGVGDPRAAWPTRFEAGAWSLAGENCSAGIRAVDAVRPPRRRGLGPGFPRPEPRQEARRPAARPNRLRARLPARRLARPPARPSAPDAPGTPCSRGPWALPGA